MRNKNSTVAVVNKSFYKTKINPKRTNEKLSLKEYAFIFSLILEQLHGSW